MLYCQQLKQSMWQFQKWSRRSSFWYQILRGMDIKVPLPTMFHFGVDFLYSTQDTQQSFQSSFTNRGDDCPFSWTSLFKSTSSTLCFGEPTHAKAQRLCETEFCPTMPTHFCNPPVTVPRPQPKDVSSRKTFYNFK